MATYTVPKASSYGGVLVNDRQEILLREVAGHFGGYAWTYPKGNPDKGETPDQTALREVREETGYEAEIIGALPGVYKGSTSTLALFIMKPVGPQGSFQKETARTRWVSLDEAPDLIKLTPIEIGRQRDMKILEDVSAFLRRKD